MSDLGSDWASSPLSRHERDFIRFVEKELKSLPRTILSEKMESKAIKIAEDRFQIGNQRARDLIRQQAEVQGFDRVSRSESESFVEQLCWSVLRNRESTAEEERQRILDAAKPWGLSDEDVDAIIQRVRTDHVRQRSRSLMAPTLLSLLITAAIVALIGTFLWWQSTRVTSTVADDSQHIDETHPPQNQLVQPRWWSGELYQSASGLAANSPQLRRRLDQVGSDQIEQRRSGYQGLIEEFGSSAGAGLDGERLADLLVSEPDSGVLRDVFSSLADSVEPPLELPTAQRLTTATRLLELVNILKRRRNEANGQAMPVGTRAALLALDEASLALTGDRLTEQYLATVAAGADMNPRAAANFLVTAKVSPSVAKSPAMVEAILSVLDADVMTWSTMQPLIDHQIHAAGRTELSVWLTWIDSKKIASLPVGWSVKFRWPANSRCARPISMKRVGKFKTF